MFVLNPLKILIVDDREDCRVLLTLVLEAEGAQVFATGCTIEAFALLRRLCPHVLISDIVMPNVDGYMLIKQIRASEMATVNSIKAIALTAHAGIESYQQAISSGFHHCLFKPVEIDELIAAILMIQA
jgi:CheY-like chemotaxis protein